MADTKIEWCDKVWNPVRGCSLVSEGCRNCYAMKQAHRFSGPGKPYEDLTELGPNGPRWNGKVRLVPELLDAPLRWRKPQRIFVNSMSDLFHEAVPPGFIRAVIQSALLAIKERGHTFIFLTKRAGRMLWYLHAEADTVFQGYLAHEPRMQFGVSVENQPTADDRVPKLLRCPVATRIVSYEPALELVDFSPWLPVESIGGVEFENWLDQIIAGGESGPGARPSHPDWFRSARDEAVAARVPFFFNQRGEWTWDKDGGGKTPATHMICQHGAITQNPIWERGIFHNHPAHEPHDIYAIARVGKKAAGRLLDGREWNEFPKTGNR